MASSKTAAGKKRITINDIAQMAGTSKTTVSFFLNGKTDRMSEETQKSIRLAIDETGYQPSPLARGMNAKQSNLIGVIIGDITKEKADLLREADFIFREEIAKADLGDICSQYFAVLTNARSVGVMGDGRTYENVLALRSVTTSDFMTAEWTRIPYEVLDRASVRIVNEVPHINRIVYDITSKPPATVEWE